MAVVSPSSGFAVPFWFLLFRPLKRNPSHARVHRRPGSMVMHLVDVYWIVEPPFSPPGPSVSWLDIAAFIGIGGVWLALFAWQLRRRPLLAEGDPRLVRAPLTEWRRGTDGQQRRAVRPGIFGGGA